MFRLRSFAGTRVFIGSALIGLQSEQQIQAGSKRNYLKFLNDGQINIAAEDALTAQEENEASVWSNLAP